MTKYFTIMNAAKKVYIIDSINTALLVSLLIQETNDAAYIIYEKKTGLSDNFQLEKICPALYPNICNVGFDVIEVESPYFLVYGNSLLKRVLLSRQYRKKIRQSAVLCENNVFVGSQTSGIMLSLTTSERIFIDHGFGEYGDRIHLIDRKSLYLWRKFKSKLKIKFGLICGNGLENHRLFTLCKIKDDWARHLDYSKVTVSKEIENIFENILSLFLEKNITLFLAAGERHSNAGLPIYSGDFDSVNLKMIKRHASPGSSIIIKFHQTLYTSGIEPQTKLVEMLEEEGFDAKIFDEHLPVEIRGKIPAEVIIKLFSVEAVICECSATIFNIAHSRGIRLIADFSFSPDFYQRNLRHYELTRLINSRVNNRVEIYK